MKASHSSLTRIRIGTYRVLVLWVALESTVLSATQPTSSAPVVYSCPRGTTAAGQSLEHAIAQASAGQKSVEFLSDETPCSYSADLTRSLDRKLHKKSFALARAHAYCWIRVNGDFLSLDQYTFSDSHVAEQVRERLVSQPDRNLPGPGVTFYQYVQIGNTLVLEVSDVHARDNAEPFFHTITNYLGVTMQGERN